MNIKRILSTALLVVMLFTTVVCAFPIGANAAYSSQAGAGGVKIPEGYEEANLSSKDLETYYNSVLGLNNDDKFPVYNSTNFPTVESLFKHELESGYLYYANSAGNTHSIYANKYTGMVYYVNNVTGQILCSNPIAPADLGSTRAKEILMSQIVIDYVETENPTSSGATDFNSFGQAASRAQINITAINGGLRVNYTLGDTTTRFLLPGMLKAQEFTDSIIVPMLDKFKAMLEEYCVEEFYDDSSYDFFTNEAYVPYRNGCFNDAKKEHGLKEYLAEIKTVPKP